MNYLKMILIPLYFLAFSNCNNTPQEELQLESYYTFDSNFIHTNSIIINNDTLMYLENDGIENNYFKAVDVNNKLPFNSVLFKGFNLGYANYMYSNSSYVFPMQENKLVQQKLNGATKILELEGNFKFNPLVYGNLIFFQERGYCVKVVSADDFDVKWTYPDPNGFSISQPILEGKNVIFMLSNNTLISCDFVTGKVNWKYKSNTGLRSGKLYGNHQEQVFILTTDLKDKVEIEAIDINNGQLLTHKKLKERIDVWITSNVIIGNKMYCKGYDNVFVYDLSSFEKLNEFNVKELSNTKLVKYNKKILFSTDNEKKLFYIDNEGLKEVQSKINIQDIIVNSNDVYLFSYPKLYKVTSDFIR
jgi:hypothetical protein